MVRSFHNKILRVNLTDRTIKVEEPGAIFYRRNMGGWNIVANTLLKEVPAGADALGPENKIIWAPGVLTGLAFSGASRSAVSALIARLPCTISLMRLCGTLMSFATRYCVMPSGFRNSSRRISPGWIGGKSRLAIC